MLIETIIKDPFESLTYCERYVNDGSPSGFTEKFITSLETNPYGSNSGFTLPFIEDKKENFIYYGKTDILDDERIKFYIHPDMLVHNDLADTLINGNETVLVTPTSSARTVLLNSTNPIYIKLHYDGLIGRINRKLNLKKAIAGVEISKEIKEAMDENVLKSEFLGILEEPLAIIHKNPSLEKQDYWGITFRNFKPKIKSKKECSYFVPFFSLFSKDRNNNDLNLISQLVKVWGESSKSILINNILNPIIDIYFEIIYSLGLQNEMNAQNLLVGFDNNSIPISIILRDFMGFEKDIDIRIKNSLDVSFDSNPYKVISSSNELYTIRHSFAFDFKVCNYVIEPLVSSVAPLINMECQDIYELLKENTKCWIKKLPEGYFPSNKWYSHDKVLLNNERKYIENINPLLR